MRLLSALLLSIFALAVASVAPAEPIHDTGPDTNAQFAALSQRWLDGSMRLSPTSATQTGDHRFDAEIDDLSADGRAKSLAFAKQTLTELGQLDRSQLSRDNQVDAAVLDNELRYEIWTAEQLQSWAWDPQIYNGVAGNALYTLAARD